MAFKFFNKKETNFPAEEKAEILEGEQFPEFPSDLQPPPDFPEFPKLGGNRFEQGFRSREELRPSARMPQMMPEPGIPTALPPFERPEPLPMPRAEPRAPEMGFESDFGPLPRVRGAPHIYIRIDKYKDVMNTVQELKEKLMATKDDLEEIHSLGESEREKIRDSAQVLLEIEKLLNYLNTTFSAPEE